MRWKGVLLGGVLEVSWAASSPPTSIFLPEISKYIYESDGELKSDSLRVDHVSRALASLASTQNALKSMDGLTHQLKNTFSDYSSLSARLELFKKKKKKSSKEATKLFEYINTVERSFQACELCQTVAIQDVNERTSALLEIDLEEVKRVTVSHGKFQCIVAILRPIQQVSSSEEASNVSRYRPREYLLVIVDDEKIAISRILKLLNKKEKMLPLKSVGFVQEEISVQPSIYALTKQVLAEAKDIIMQQANVSLNVADSTPDIALHNNSIANTSSSSSTSPPKFLRLVGYSVGGGVAGLVTMILDGTLRTKDPDLQPFTGLYKDAIKCIALGPPPSSSRSIISRNVISVICGDDCITRATHETLEHLKDRVVGGLRRGAGRGGLRGITYAMGPGLLNDLSAVAGASLRQYTAGQHDLSSLHVPGRVFFIKTRKHKMVGN